jgi:hypothetical protein
MPTGRRGGGRKNNTKRILRLDKQSANEWTDARYACVVLLNNHRVP